MIATSAHAAATLSYPASFFSAAHPNTAYDMIRRLPGFVFDDGTDARGYAGTGGNVLVDGQRPTAKTDDLKSILERIPASNVERIDVISGNSSGIDMEGHTVVANVIRKFGVSTDIIASASTNIWPDGHTVHDLKLEYTNTDGDWR
ncbi:MAG: TonB-dependent receptor, partial [Alphaproteobacteria bacterium]|nr:TonB-dependent receptor [Alphaproteobacteria bacterium]